MYILSQNSWNNPTDYSRNELVFELRNKTYGAYAIRVNYNNTLIKSLVLAAFIIFSLFMITKASSSISKNSIPATIQDTDTTSIIITPPPDNSIEKNKIIKPKIKSNGLLIDPTKKIVDEKVNNNDTSTKDERDKIKNGIAARGDGDINGDDDLFPDVASFTNGKNVISTIKNESDIAQIYTSEMPEFIGGNDKINPFICENINYPLDAVGEGMEAKLRVGFIVEKDGSISNIKILECSERGLGFENEAIRVISIMPRWKPGMQNGHAARVYFNIPISFRLI